MSGSQRLNSSARPFVPNNPHINANTTPLGVSSAPLNSPSAPMSPSNMTVTSNGRQATSVSGSSRAHTSPSSVRIPFSLPKETKPPPQAQQPIYHLPSYLRPASSKEEFVMRSSPKPVLLSSSRDSFALAVGGPTPCRPLPTHTHPSTPTLSAPRQRRPSEVPDAEAEMLVRSHKLASQACKYYLAKYHAALPNITPLSHSLSIPFMYCALLARGPFRNAEAHLPLYKNPIATLGSTTRPGVLTDITDMLEFLSHHHTGPPRLMKVVQHVAERILASKFQMNIVTSNFWYDPATDPEVGVARWFNLTADAAMEYIHPGPGTKEIRERIALLIEDERENRDHMNRKNRKLAERIEIDQALKAFFNEVKALRKMIYDVVASEFWAMAIHDIDNLQLSTAALLRTPKASTTIALK